MEKGFDVFSLPKKKNKKRVFSAKRLFLCGADTQFLIAIKVLALHWVGTFFVSTSWSVWDL
jgi:hypothetical protein